MIYLSRDWQGIAFAFRRDIEPDIALDHMVMIDYGKLLPPLYCGYSTSSNKLARFIFKDNLIMPLVGDFVTNVLTSLNVSWIEFPEMNAIGIDEAVAAQALSDLGFSSSRITKLLATPVVQSFEDYLKSSAVGDDDIIAASPVFLYAFRNLLADFVSENSDSDSINFLKSLRDGNVQCTSIGDNSSTWISFIKFAQRKSSEVGIAVKRLVLAVVHSDQVKTIEQGLTNG